VIIIVVPVAELYVIFKAGDLIGWAPTLALLVASSILGMVLMRSQGRTAWHRFTAAIQQGRTPHREVLDGALIVSGGAFLIPPGFLTDVIGLTLLLPPTRALWRQAIVRRSDGRFARYVASAGPNRRRREDWDVEGSAVEQDPPGFETGPKRLER
jgi:UPF0716 protein FxsA